MTDTPDLVKLAEWADEAARYFQKRDDHGEDMAFWANVYNAENARKIAAALRTHAAALQAQRKMALEEAGRKLDEAAAAAKRSADNARDLGLSEAQSLQEHARATLSSAAVLVRDLAASLSLDDMVERGAQGFKCVDRDYARNVTRAVITTLLGL